MQRVLLSGGSGARLRPSSCESHPKQFLPLGGDDTMLQATWKRVAPIATAAPIVVANEAHRFLVVEQLLRAGSGDHPYCRSGAANDGRRQRSTGALQAGQSTYIPLGAKHRPEHPRTQVLELIEVQSGDYLGKDDIVRGDNVYGRE